MAVSGVIRGKDKETTVRRRGNLFQKWRGSRQLLLLAAVVVHSPEVNVIACPRYVNDRPVVKADNAPPAFTRAGRQLRGAVRVVAQLFSLPSRFDRPDLRGAIERNDQ